MRLTFKVSPLHVDACETRAAREGIQRPCGSEQSKYRQRCQWVQVSDGLGHHFKCMFTLQDLLLIFLQETSERTEVDLLDVRNG